MTAMQCKRINQRGRGVWPILALVVGLILGTLLILTLRPSSILARRQAELLHGIESRNQARLLRLVSHNYEDRWGFNREDISSAMVDAGRQFMTLVLTPKDPKWEFKGKEATVSMGLTVGGKAVGPAAIEVMRQINQIEQPFEMIWRKESFLPSGWKLVQVNQPALPDDLYGYHPGDIGRAMAGEFSSDL